MDSFEVAILLQEAQQKKKAEQEEAEKEKVRVEEVKKIGRLRYDCHFSRKRSGGYRGSIETK
jgi:hypothetical protein